MINTNNKNVINSFYGVNLIRLKFLLIFFGFSNFKNLKLNKFLSFIDNTELNLFFIKNIQNSDFIIKRINDNILKNIDNGSYKGYKFCRGLPIYNQRTKTNSKTSRKVNIKKINVFI